MPIQCTCLTCGVAFSRPPSTVGRKRGTYCSRACYFDKPARPLAERFWAKVDREGQAPSPRPELGNCWVWTATLSDGYGQISLGGSSRRHAWAHRASWEIHFGAIPDGLWVLHRCDNRPCVRPDHLFLGTSQDNVDDMLTKGRGSVQSKQWRQSRPRGEHNASALVTEAQVREIRALAAHGTPQRAIALTFGVSRPTVTAIVSRRTWAHVV